MEYKETTDFIRSNRGTEVYTECSADYSLPDYNGDVRKILFTDAVVHPAGSFEDGDSVDFSGIVSYSMIYADSENRINSVVFNSDYDFSIKSDAEKREGSFADISVASYSIRLLGPRKISAKATLSASVTTSERVNMSPDGSAFSSGELPEVKCETIDILVTGRCESIEREYADELVRFDGAISDEINIIYSDAECVVDSAVLEESGVAIRGNVRAYALIENGDSPVCLYEKNIRIDETVPYENVKSDKRMIPFVTLNSVRSTVSADENGCSVVANVIIGLFAENVGNDQLTVVTDAYRKDIDTKESFEDFRYSELITNVTERDEFSGSVSRENIEPSDICDIVCLNATSKIENIDFDGESVTVCGEIKYNGIATSRDDEGKTSCHPFKTSIEFKKNVNIGCKNESEIKVLPYINCYNSSASVDENNVYLSCKAEIRLSVSESKCIKVLSSSDIIEDKEFENIDSKITVYYPEQGEGLFDIAKKFHTTVERLMENNSAAVRAMSSDTAGNTGTQKLIIY